MYVGVHLVQPADSGEAGPTGVTVPPAVSGEAGPSGVTVPSSDGE